jgi:ribosomal protein S18 acetylase RimI-like enzyme
MLSSIYHLLKGPNPLHPAVWKDKLSPMAFRRFQPTDAPACIELYALNEKGRFPEGVMDQYRKSLDVQKSYYLVGERDGRIVTSGGVSYWMRDDMAVLCFGLVHPDYQRRGLGTALLLARLALLNPNRPNYRVLIFALDKAIPFYRRFGFQDFTPWLDPGGNKNPSGCLQMTAGEIRRCRALLQAHDISIPADETQIPFRMPAE